MASAACAVDSAKSSHRANLCAPLARLELEATDFLLGKLLRNPAELYLESAHSVNYPFGRKGLCGDSCPGSRLAKRDAFSSRPQRQPPARRRDFLAISSSNRPSQ